VKDLSVTPRPVQQPSPPIWMAACAEAPLGRAVKHADVVIAVGSPDLIRLYRQFVAEEGRDLDPASVAVLRYVIISADPESTWAEVEPSVR
jgi:alkanesulfonate monooxygenase SsuD/methylene tetrahydromethanopterin reductase-like flavin-dependent oxidoreductase (luciferase family)